MMVWQLLFLAADVWMTAIGLWYGVAFLRRRGNPLIGIEWLIMGVSGANALAHALIGASHHSPTYHLMIFFDAFSRSVGFTLLVVLGLMKLTHHFKPSAKVDLASFGVGIVLGCIWTVHAEEIGLPGKVFLLGAGLLTMGFLAYFARLLWLKGQRTHAAWTGLVAAMNAVICSIYDFWHIPGDDADHTIFYTFALFTWGLTMLVIYHAYSAFEDQELRESTPRNSHMPATR